MNNPLFDISQYQSPLRPRYRPDWRDATGTDPAWDEPDLKPNLETRIEVSDDETPTGWQSADEFTITVQSGQTIEVKFIPSLEGELRMHSFNFTGSISPTGFKSHFVLAIESEEFSHPRDYAQVYAQKLITQMEKKHSSKGTKRSLAVALRQAPEDRTADNDNSTQENAMPENNAPELKNTPVEVVEELSPEEEADRQGLELKVERGIEQIERTFYQIGIALAELRDRRLYRSTHRNWSDYCNERFNRIKRRQADYFILASEVINDLNRHNCARFPLPTSESQVRSMKNLSTAERIEVWQTGVIESDGEVPTAKTIKGIVERLKQRNTTPPPIPFQAGDVVLIRGLGNSELRKYDGKWAIALSINEYTVTLALDGKDVPVKPQFLEPVDPKYWGEIKAVNERITRLQLECDLDPMDDVALEFLRRRTCFTQRQMVLLERIEQDYVLT